MATNVLPQLQSVEAELTSQVEALTAQLEEAKEKLSGIQTVLQMYSGTDDSEGDSSKAETDATETVPDHSEAAAAEEPEAVSAVEASAVETSGKKEGTKKKTTQKKAAQKKTAEKKTTNKKTAKKKDGRAATWQKYARPEFKGEAIPDAVKSILETKPDQEFRIAEVMDTLFKENMPKAQYLKARNRISNVLSGGVRAGDWYKGQRGTYRMTAA